MKDKIKKVIPPTDSAENIKAHQAQEELKRIKADNEKHTVFERLQEPAIFLKRGLLVLHGLSFPTQTFFFIALFYGLSQWLFASIALGLGISVLIEYTKYHSVPYLLKQLVHGYLFKNRIFTTFIVAFAIVPLTALVVSFYATTAGVKDSVAFIINMSSPPLSKDIVAIKEEAIKKIEATEQLHNKKIAATTAIYQKDKQILEAQKKDYLTHKRHLVFDKKLGKTVRSWKARKGADSIETSYLPALKTSHEQQLANLRADKLTALNLLNQQMALASNTAQTFNNNQQENYKARKETWTARVSIAGGVFEVLYPLFVFLILLRERGAWLELPEEDRQPIKRSPTPPKAKKKRKKQKQQKQVPVQISVESPTFQGKVVHLKQKDKTDKTVVKQQVQSKTNLVATDTRYLKQLCKTYYQRSITSRTEKARINNKASYNRVKKQLEAIGYAIKEGEKTIFFEPQKIAN